MGPIAYTVRYAYLTEDEKTEWSKPHFHMDKADMMSTISQLIDMGIVIIECNREMGQEWLMRYRGDTLTEMGLCGASPEQDLQKPKR